MILDGAALARSLNQALKEKAARLARPPGLAVVYVGDDPASAIYVRRKGEVAERLGFRHRQIDLPATTPQSTLEAVVDGLVADDAVDGILVQFPLPRGLDGNAVMDRVDPAKDADGFHPRNTGLLSQQRATLVACTPLGVMELLKHTGVALSGLEACIIGRSNIVGRPMAMLLEQANCTVTVCHSRTRNLEAAVRRADVVVAAVGVPRLVKGDWVKPGSVVIDVGMNRDAGGGLCGDVDFEAASARAAWITPVPGGVGPMTIAMLMRNTYTAAVARQSR